MQCNIFIIFQYFLGIVIYEFWTKKKKLQELLTVQLSYLFCTHIMVSQEMQQMQLKWRDTPFAGNSWVKIMIDMKMSMTSQSNKFLPR